MGDDHGQAALYRAFVSLDLPGQGKAAVRSYLETADSAAPGWTDVDRAFLLDLVARSGELTCVRTEPLVKLPGNPGRHSPRQTKGQREKGGGPRS